MIDVNKITSTLAKLPDQQLQQYAQMHKADPYIMALAMSESNRRKEMRAAGQGGQGMQEQPKVVDQMVAEMAPQQLPEDMGIGQLPAGNMNFASGGIIAFADGGDVERYQYGGMPPQSSMLGDIPGFVAGTGNFIPQPGVPENEPILRRLYREMSERNAAARDAEERRRVNEGRAAPSERMLAEAAAAKVNPAQDMAQFDAASNLYMTERANKQAAAAAPKAEPAPTVKAAPTVDTTRRAVPKAGLGAAAAAAASKDDPFSMSSIRKAQTEAMGDTNYKIGELNNQLVDIRNRAETQVQQRLEDRKKEIESEGDVYKDRSDRLVERGKALAGQKDQNTGLALLNAGLAIMSTPGGLMTAIGKGAQVGTAQYAAGIKDLRAAQERLDEANDRISDLRMNRKDLNSREIRALEKDRDAAILDGQKMVFGFAKDIYGMDRKQAEATFTSYMSGQEKKAEIKSREGIAALDRDAADTRAARNPQLELLEAVKKDPRLAAAYQSMHGKGEDVMGQYNEFLKANPVLAQDPQQAMTQFLMSKSVFSQLGKPTVTDKPSTTVRTQP
jgi:hypothetical protein